MREAEVVRKDLIDFCGKSPLLYHPVITLVHEDSDTNEKYFHAVRMSKIFTTGEVPLLADKFEDKNHRSSTVVGRIHVPTSLLAEIDLENNH